jgi:hypothetical protein
MTLRRIKHSSGGAITGLEIDDAPIACLHIGPTVVPARIKRDAVDGGEYGEKAARFRIV